jgi:hypothetical protein
MHPRLTGPPAMRDASHRVRTVILGRETHNTFYVSH